jgi:uncharacterized membrane protein
MLGLFRWLQNNPLIIFMDSSPASSAILEVMHYFGFFLLVGSVAVVNIRLLRRAGGPQPASQLYAQVSKIMWVGLVLALFSGFVMFAGSATQYYNNGYFYLKVAVVVAAIISGAIVQANLAKWDRLPAIPASAKMLAILTIALWIGAILAGVEIPALTGVG